MLLVPLVFDKLNWSFHLWLHFPLIICVPSCDGFVWLQEYGRIIQLGDPGAAGPLNPLYHMQETSQVSLKLGTMLLSGNHLTQVNQALINNPCHYHRQHHLYEIYYCFSFDDKTKWYPLNGLMTPEMYSDTFFPFYLVKSFLWLLSGSAHGNDEIQLPTI